MTISFNRYINIISGVGGGAAVATRELILRVVSNHPVIPPGIVVEFTNADAVGEYFGTTDVQEYERSVKYFGFVSKSIRSPKKISFSRWVDVDIAPMIVGDANPKDLADWTPIAAGTLSLTVDGTVEAITGIDTSAATSLTDVAAIIQTAIRTSSTPQLVSAVVSFNTNTNQFVLTGSTTGSGDIQANATGPADVSALLGWTTAQTVNVPGQPADNPVDAISKSEKISSNFGSFVFDPFWPTETPENLAKFVSVAAWNHAKNNRYMFLFPTTIAQMTALWEAAKGMSGTGVTLSNVFPAEYDYPEQCPAEILAATDYNSINATQNYMFYQFGNRAVMVSDDSTADDCDAVRANYNGVTETAGQQLAFYQRGVLFGDATAAVDMNTYANEMWLKDYIGSKMLSMFLNSPTISANKKGRASLLSVLQSSTDAAVLNGVISSGKTLTNEQKQYITQVTNNDNAWRQVQDAGSYYDLWFTNEPTPDGRTEKVANYVLIYSKDDAVRKVNGTNTMI